MQVSIVIVNYHTIAFITKAISSIIEKTKNVEYEIIIVDNNSGDDFSLLEHLNYNFLHIHKLPENIGFGRANNYGVSKAVGEYVLFLNPDTLLRNNAIYYLYHALEDNNEYGIVGGNLFSKEGTPNLSYGLFLPSISEELYGTTENLFHSYYMKRNYFFNFTGKHKEVAYITGADIMMRRDLFNNIGGFDKRFFMYCEDADLAARVKKRGLKIVSIPKAEILHFEGKSVVFKESRFWLTYTGRKTYFNIHYSKAYTLLANILRLFYMFISCLLYMPYIDKLRIQVKKIILFFRVCF